MGWCFGREGAALLVSHTLQLWRLPVHRGSPPPDPDPAAGNCKGCYEPYPSFKTPCADTFDFACDEIHVCPECEEGFRLSGTVPES